MNRAKIFIVLTFLLTFAVCVSAQINEEISNLTEHEFLEKGKVKNLQFIISTKKDIEKSFGETCEKKCKYSENWEIRFNYINESMHPKIVVNGVLQHYKPRPEFIGKLAGISFFPKNESFLPESVLIPNNFKCRNNFFISTDETKVCFSHLR